MFIDVLLDFFIYYQVFEVGFIFIFDVFHIHILILFIFCIGSLQQLFFNFADLIQNLLLKVRLLFFGERLTWWTFISAWLFFPNKFLLTRITRLFADLFIEVLACLIIIRIWLGTIKRFGPWLRLSIWMRNRPTYLLQKFQYIEDIDFAPFGDIVTRNMR